MSRTVAPLLSWGASGQIAQTQVYSTWKGRPYVRRYVVPANPRTQSQTTTRNAFKELQLIFPYLPADAVGSWELYASNLRYTGRNAFTHVNLTLIRGESDLDKLLPSIAAAGGIAAASAVVTPGDGEIDITLTAPVLPSDWAITTAFAVAVESVDPSAPSIPQIVGATQATGPYAMTLSGLTNGTKYVVSGAFVYEKPDGSTAYGAPSVSTATPTL